MRSLSVAALIPAVLAANKGLNPNPNQSFDPATNQGTFGPFQVARNPTPDAQGAANNINAVQKQAMQLAISNWMTDTGIVTSFQDTGPTIQDDQTFRRIADGAFKAEVDELSQKAVLDQIIGLDPRVSIANQTLTNGVFQSVVDNLQIMSLQGLQKNNLIDAINQVRCVQILPSIDTYMIVAAEKIGQFAQQRRAVRPDACNQVLSQNQNAQNFPNVPGVPGANPPGTGDGNVPGVPGVGLKGGGNLQANINGINAGTNGNLGGGNLGNTGNGINSGLGSNGISGQQPNGLGNGQLGNGQLGNGNGNGINSGLGNGQLSPNGINGQSNGRLNNNRLLPRNGNSGNRPSSQGSGTGVGTGISGNGNINGNQGGSTASGSQIENLSNTSGIGPLPDQTTPQLLLPGFANTRNNGGRNNQQTSPRPVLGRRGTFIDASRFD